MNIERTIAGSVEKYILNLRKDSESVLDLEIAFEKSTLADDNSPELITTFIAKEKKFSQENALRGVGVQLYGKVLEYFSFLAKNRHKNYLHRVEKTPFFIKNQSDLDGDQQMRNEKRWDDVFAKLLIDQGYEKVVQAEGRDIWNKEYSAGK